MEYLVTAEEMEQYHIAAMEKIGIPALVLAERSALAVAQEIQAVSPAGDVLILAGVGKNGSVGLALARILLEEGYEAEVVVCGDLGKAAGLWKEQAAILENYKRNAGLKGLSAGRKPSKKEYTVLADALLGAGLSEEVSEECRSAIEEFNALKGYKIAVDVPSGICSDTGRVRGCAVKADLTVCLGFGKRGLFFYPGSEYAGCVKAKKIGIGERALLGGVPQMYRYTESLRELLPARKKNGNKGTFGKVLLAAGSRNMAGAAVLSARACYKSGAGMVKVTTPEENREILQTAVPEALLHTYKENGEGLEDLDWDWPDVLAVGPGIGTGEGAYKLLRYFLEKSRKPMVIDADGLNLLAKSPDLAGRLAAQAAGGRAFLLTPHPGELSRLCGEPAAGAALPVAESAMALAERLHCVVVGKDARTVVCKSGHPVCLNVTGNSGMATAGSGDVLAGVASALLAQGMEPFEAAAVGVYWHGMAGDAAAARLGEYGVTASSLVDFLPAVL